MPPSRFLISKYYTRVVILILLLNKIIPTYSRYVLKGLIYITIIVLSSYQPSSYTKYTKSNIRSSYNIQLVSTNKYLFFAYFKIL